MLFSTTLVLALCGVAAAVPTSEHVARKQETCPPSYDKDGNYQDGGCGTNINPGNAGKTGRFCLQTEWDTRLGSKLFLAGCTSDKFKGGRWDLTTGGGTLIRNMQAKTRDFCISATRDLTGVQMSHCTGQPRQSWYSDGSYVKLADRNLCLAAYGDWTFQDQEGNKGAVPGTIVILEPCVLGRVSQNFTFPALAAA